MPGGRQETTEAAIEDPKSRVICQDDAGVEGDAPESRDNDSGSVPGQAIRVTHIRSMIRR